jgi:hypothetical protein
MGDFHGLNNHNSYFLAFCQQDRVRRSDVDLGRDVRAGDAQHELCNFSFDFVPANIFQFKDKIISALIEQAPKVCLSRQSIAIMLTSQSFRLPATSYPIYLVAKSRWRLSLLPPCLLRLSEARPAHL